MMLSFYDSKDVINEAFSDFGLLGAVWIACSSRCSIKRLATCEDAGDPTATPSVSW